MLMDDTSHAGRERSGVRVTFGSACDADFYFTVVRPGGSVETHTPELSVLGPVLASPRVPEYRCEV